MDTGETSLWFHMNVKGEWRDVGVEEKYIKSTLGLFYISLILFGFISDVQRFQAFSECASLIFN